VRPDSVDEEQYRALKEFKQYCREHGLIQEYDSASDFREKFFRQLSQTVIRHFPGPIAPESESTGVTPLSPSIPESLGELAKMLLLAAADGTDGRVVVFDDSEGFAIHTGGRNLYQNGTRRDDARWKGAIKELQMFGLIEDVGYKGEIYNVTDMGYFVADRLRHDAESSSTGSP
jgi:hypothetical protein